ncbi:MAG: ribonuclease PH [Oligoflexia bacterium]|nr:ribonuclease PH [Oligoflexia bacterium]
MVKRTATREIKFTPNINPYAAGSVLAEFGNTKVHITACISDDVPPFLKGKGTGWITAEYGMLPGSTNERLQRERKGLSGRFHEIQRLIGRALRAGIDLSLLGARSILIDCDVLVADGGTRTAAISGAYVALVLAVRTLLRDGKISQDPIKEQLAAISVGIDASSFIYADLNYQEDSSFETDMNLVMTASGKFIEIQGTAERGAFSPEQLWAMMICGKNALSGIFAEQNRVLR